MREITWNQFNKIYGIGITEHISHDVEIGINEGGYYSYMKGRPFVSKYNKSYSFTIYNRETDKDVYTDDSRIIEHVDEIADIIIEEFNIIEG